MAVMGATSAGLAGRSVGWGMGEALERCLGNLPDGRANAKGPAKRGPSMTETAGSLFAIAEQLQQHHEHVDEVEVEVEGTHDGLLGSRRRVAHHRVVVVLDLLGIVGGKTRKH